MPTWHLDTYIILVLYFTFLSQFLQVGFLSLRFLGFFFFFFQFAFLVSYVCVLVWSYLIFSSVSVTFISVAVSFLETLCLFCNYFAHIFFFYSSF